MDARFLRHRFQFCVIQFYSPLTRASRQFVSQQPVLLSFLLHPFGTRLSQYEQIMAILVRMRSTGVQPDVTTYTAMLAGCKRSADWIRAESLVSDMQAYGVKPNSRTTTAMLKVRIEVVCLKVSPKPP